MASTTGTLAMHFLVDQHLMALTNENLEMHACQVHAMGAEYLLGKDHENEVEEEMQEI